MGGSIGWLLSFTFLMAFLGSMFGWLYWGTSQGVAIGGAFWVTVALWLGMWKLAKLMHPDAFVEYESVSESPTIVERVTLVINVPGLPGKRVHGFSASNLQLIGACVTNGYIFNVQHFKDYFKATEHDGYSLYNKSVRWMQDCGALAPNSKGGWDVTEHIGKQVFDAMRDEAWEVIEELPHPSA